MILIGTSLPPSPSYVAPLSQRNVQRAQGPKTRTSKTQIDKEDGRVEPSSWGDIRGRIYDLATGAPIAGATISVQNEGAFLPKGATVARTDKEGAYKARAVLGRIRNNFDVGRALLSSGIGLLFGTATNKTKRIDVEEVNVRVEAAGYAPLEGVLRAHRQDAGKFALFMEPILLARANAGRSFFAEGYAPLQLKSVVIEPEIVAPGGSAKIVATVTGIGNSRRTVSLRAEGEDIGGRKDLKFDRILPDGTAVYVHKFKVGRKSGRTTAVYVGFRQTPEDVSGSTTLLSLIQVAGNPADESRARSRRDLVVAYLNDDSESAVRAFQSFGADQAQDVDLSVMAEVYDRASNPRAAVELRERLDRLAIGRKVSMKERVPMRIGLLESLVGAKEDAKAIVIAKETYAGVPRKERAKYFPASFLALYGIAAVRTGDLETGKRMNVDLIDFPYAGLDPKVIEFRAVLRLTSAERAVAKEPASSSALAELGRALADAGRIEESLDTLRRASEAGGGGAVARDAAYVALRLGKAPETPLPLGEAAAQARLELGLGKGEKRSKDFASWRRYALLTYAHAKEQEAAKNPDAPVIFDEAIVALRESLSVARSGAKENKGSYEPYYSLYTSGSTVTIAGFAYPEAEACFGMLQALKVLRKSPEEPFARYNLALALANLELPRLARDEVALLKAVAPNFADLPYVEALVLSKLNEEAVAIELLSAFTEASPQHPKASLLLAKLYAQEGNPSGAARARARHAAFYGRIPK